MNKRRIKQPENKAGFLVVVILICISTFTHQVYSQVLPLSGMLPESFSESAFQHIEKLVNNGPRQAGTENEMKAAEYIKNKFEEIGLETEIEFFEYESYEFSELNLSVNNLNITPVGLGFTPYKEICYYEGDAVLIGTDTPEEDLNPGSIAGRTIVSDDYTSHFQLLLYQPNLIIYVDPADFNLLKSCEKINYRLKIQGHYRKFISPNVIGLLGDASSKSKEVIIGAHLDSYRKSQGASDNGSGIGVLIELARYFKEIENDLLGNIRFVAFGAEEIGILGSRRYIMMHPEIIDNCGLYFNIDDVGGNGAGIIQVLGGVSAVPAILNDDLSQRLACQPWEGATSLWRAMPETCLMNFITTVNHPDWFVELVDSAISDTGYQIMRVGNPGADEMSFSRAGIVSTSIGIQGRGTHTPEDNPTFINKESLRKAGEITARVVLRTLYMLNGSDNGKSR